jgi:hypothetical protein
MGKKLRYIASTLWGPSELVLSVREEDALEAAPIGEGVLEEYLEVVRATRRAEQLEFVLGCFQDLRAMGKAIPANLTDFVKSLPIQLPK